MFKPCLCSVTKKLTFVLLCLIAPLIANCQERIVDDAAITNFRSFQIETWYAQFESTFIPAIGWNNWLETSVGLLFDSEGTFDFSGFMLEGKIVNADYEEAGQALSLVSGSIFDNNFRIEELYALVPYSRLFLNGTSVLHLNAGATLSNLWDLSLVYGARADWGITPRFDILTSVFAENVTPSFYGGFRLHLIPDLLFLIPTYGKGLIVGQDIPGWSLQLSFTPQQLW